MSAPSRLDEYLSKVGRLQRWVDLTVGFTDRPTPLRRPIQRLEGQEWVDSGLLKDR